MERRLVFQGWNVGRGRGGGEGKSQAPPPHGSKWGLGRGKGEEGCGIVSGVGLKLQAAPGPGLLGSTLPGSFFVFDRSMRFPNYSGYTIAEKETDKTVLDNAKYK